MAAEASQPVVVHPKFGHLVDGRVVIREIRPPERMSAGGIALPEGATTKDEVGPKRCPLYYGEVIDCAPLIDKHTLKRVEMPGFPIPSGSLVAFTNMLLFDYWDHVETGHGLTNCEYITNIWLPGQWPASFRGK